MLNIFFSGSSEGKAHHRKKELGLDGERITSIELSLHAGDISAPMSVGKRRKIYDLIYNGYGDIVSNNIRQLKRKLKNETGVCLWYSIKDTDEYLGMLAMLEYLKDKEMTVYMCEYSDMVNVLVYLDDNKTVNLPERKLLEMNEYQRLLDEWTEIKSVNAELRIIRNGKIQNMSADYIDKKIFDIIGNDNVSVCNIVKPIIEEYIPRMLTFAEYRIRQLIEYGQLEEVKQDVHKITDGFMETVVRRKRN